MDKSKYTFKKLEGTKFKSSTRENYQIVRPFTIFRAKLRQENL